VADVLVVVAAGPGLGRSVAARASDGLRDLADEIRGAGSPRVAVAAGDAGDEQSLRSAMRQLASALGPATVLAYNGSAYVTGSALTVPPADLRTALDVGVVGALVAAQEVAPAMREAGAGTILLTGSVAADRASTGAAAVGVAKAGLRNLALSLHKALAPDGVRVVTVTIDGVLQGPNALDPAGIADRYWALHTQDESPPAVETFPG
jgi:NAD(P)-dependent dehydrogenase (short-subunit alcohol dehydrogenase family)